jgi:arginyl-tRNA synthetase
MLDAHQTQVIALIEQALGTLGLGPACAPGTVRLERPKDAAHGDFSCTIALQLAKPLQKNPRELAQAIATALSTNAQAAQLIAQASVAGPGFINLTLAPGARQAVVRQVLQEGARFGWAARGAGQRVLLEFVSANPTGPLHLGHARQAALGDALAHPPRLHDDLLLHHAALLLHQ